ncbi:MAG: SMC-Scp complex subunit ScpB [Clostridiaceae bacterium]|nr:SMC-Scp complex subunit ScpB [Clostridiaceae bacterium]
MQESTNEAILEGLMYQTSDDLSREAATEESRTLDPADLEAAVEAILFASGDPVTLERIASVTGLQRDHARKVLQDLTARMEADRSRGVTIHKIRDTYVLSTKPEMNQVMRVLFQPRNRPPLSQAAYEALAIVAYNQPVTRSRIEAVRGVGSDGILARLVERGLVRECGTLDAPGRPSLFETTDTFLREFGLTSVADLPPMEMLMVGTLRGIEHALDPNAAGPDDRQITVDQWVSALVPGGAKADESNPANSFLDTEALYREEEERTPG